MRFTQSQLKKWLTFLRNDIRDGKIRVTNGQLRAVVLATIREEARDLAVQPTTEFFTPGTVSRLERLFAVPNMGDEATGNVWPTQDNYAWALQNFMNRRLDPWGFKTRELYPQTQSAVA